MNLFFFFRTRWLLFYCTLKNKYCFWVCFQHTKTKHNLWRGLHSLQKNQWHICPCQEQSWPHCDTAWLRETFCFLGPLCHGASLADLLWPLGFPNIQVFSKACLLWSIRRGACFQLWRSLGSETLMTCPSCPCPFRNMFSLSALRVAVPMNVLPRSVWAAMHSQLYEFSSRNYASSAVLESWVLNGW